MGEKTEEPPPAVPDQAGRSTQGSIDVAGPPPPIAEPRQEPPQRADSGAPPATDQAQTPSLNAPAVHPDTTPLPQPGRPGPYNMEPIASALPQDPYGGAQYPQSSHPRYMSTPPSSTMRHMSRAPQYGVLPPVPLVGQGYFGQHPSPVTQYYGTGHMTPAQSQTPIHPRQQSMPYYTNQMLMGHTQPTYYYPQATSSYNVGAHGMPPTANLSQYVAGSPTTIVDGSRQPIASTGGPHMQSEQKKHATGTNERRQSAVRGPPRKPRQSAHAIWIGNLPPQTELMTLVEHVCKEAPGLESLFLISKSNCAFANYKNEEVCSEAQQKLHDSKFNSVRLVSRLRKSTVEGAGGATAPSGPSAATSTVSPKEEPASMSPSETGSGSPIHLAESTSRLKSTSRQDGSQKDRFFILKSLTVEDLELSLGTGTWATQSHNEGTLNKAFKSADNVYLVFSANKSGEYFGYARMISEINEDPAAAIEFAPKSHSTTDVDLPKAIPTEPTEHVPRGRIIDDSARGTIFWELESEDGEGDGESGDEEDSASGKNANNEEEESQAWGKPLKLEWLSTNRLPFYRTRGLRNPWNSNREVKVARDGTELEPSVGRRLIGLFNRLQNPPPPVQPMRAPVGIAPPFPQMRPFGP